MCEDCGSKDFWYLSARRSFQCQYCNSQRSITADTMFQASHTPLREWFLAIYLVTESKKGISALKLAHHLGITDSRRASRLKRRIQEAMTARNKRYLLKGFVKLDEAVFIEGGENTNVLVAVSLEEDTGSPKYVRFRVVENMKAVTLESAVTSCIEASADIARMLTPVTMDLANISTSIFPVDKPNRQMPLSTCPGFTFLSPTPNASLTEPSMPSITCKATWKNFPDDSTAASAICFTG